MDMKLMTVKEVAATLRLGSQTVYRMLWSGEIPNVKTKGKRLVSEQALRDYLDGRMQHAHAVREA